jgi:exodeoxyribonuclease VII small subunit
MSKKSYQEIRDELDEVLQALGSIETDVDKAQELYQRGVKLVTEMEKYLDKTQNTIEQVNK